MRKQVNLWMQKDGKRIRICDMEDRHLVNCVNLLKQFGEAKLQETIRVLLRANVRGDRAQDAVMRELDEIADHEWHQHVPKIFWNMIDDVKRRALLRPGIIDNLIGIPNWIVRD